MSFARNFCDTLEVLTPADIANHVDKMAFKVPFVCGARNLGEALRRINEGAALIRTKGEAGTGDVVEAVRHMRDINAEMQALAGKSDSELQKLAEEMRVPLELVKLVASTGHLPVPNFAAGGIATPADAALMMQLGAEALFVGSGIFKSGDPAKRASAIVQAAAHYDDADLLAKLSEDIGEAMVGINIEDLEPGQKLASRGW